MNLESPDIKMDEAGSMSTVEYSVERSEEKQRKPQERIKISAADARNKSTPPPVESSSVNFKRPRKLSHKAITVSAESMSCPVRKKPKSSRDTETDFSWICAVCKEAECVDDADAVLIMCDGKCNRPFHNHCVGLNGEAISEQSWVCSDCLSARHSCAVCHEYGVDSKDVYPCERRDCGLFFHESCLANYNVDIRQVPVCAPNGLIDKDILVECGEMETKPVFRCPSHQCWTCTEEFAVEEHDSKSLRIKSVTKGEKKRRRGRQSNSSTHAFLQKPDKNLFRCLECPIAYHLSCIPPLAKFHELALLCHDHAGNCKLPDLDMKYSLQGALEAQADKQLEDIFSSKQAKRTKQRYGVSITNQSNVFFLGLQGDMISAEENKVLDQMGQHIAKTDDDRTPTKLENLQFCLPVEYKEEVHAKPPPFRFIHSLRYGNHKVKRHDPSGGICNCEGACNENCHNRIIAAECVGDKNKGAGEKNRYWNCNLGLECGNRALGRREITKCKPMREQGKGWGLVPLQNVKKGDLVQEYVGEVIDEKTKEQRLVEWSQEHPNDPNFYIMHLDTGLYIDARLEANLSRFINHSCAPNCQLKRVNVGGYMRIGIFAVRDVQAGEFLSYDYQFDTKHGDKFICRCGAVTCRGTMKGGKQVTGADEKLSKSNEWAKAKVAYDRDLKYLEDVERIQKQMASSVDEKIPGYEFSDELVSNGPRKERSHGVMKGVFLWRNAWIGSNFSDRDMRRKRRQKNKKRKPPMRDPRKIDVLSTLRVGL